MRNVFISFEFYGVRYPEVGRSAKASLACKGDELKAMQMNAQADA